MPVDKATRRARHEAATSPSLNTTNFNDAKSGAEGQQAFREEGGKVKQMVKKNGSWREVG